MKADLLYFQNFKKKKIFSSACKIALEKKTISKKSKISAFFTKNILFSQKLDFRGKQTKYCQNCFETEKYKTFPTKQRQPRHLDKISQS